MLSMKPMFLIAKDIINPKRRYMVMSPINYSTQLKRLFINMIGKIVVVQLEDLLYMEASSNYTEFTLKDGISFKASKSLKTFSDQIESHPDFIRIHRAFVINKKYLKHIIRENNKTCVVMFDNKELEISPSKKEEILNNLLY